jgi:methylated-DNA-protein-cysteine methyltransferase-like protein
MKKSIDERTEFTKKVIKLIKAIPEGKVATYGLIAKLAGKPQGSRGVGWILHSSSHGHELPWQRVIKSGGTLSFPEMTEPYFRQKRLLELEGVTFTNGKIDLKKYLWDKKLPSKDGSKKLK